MSDFCCTSKISAQTNECVISLVFRTCIYYLEIRKQSSAVIADLTNDQAVSMTIRTRMYQFKVVKQASATTVDLWIISRWVAGTIMWSHLF
jgi:ribosomal protein S2